MSLNSVLHEIVQHLPHRQEVLDDLHTQIDDHVPEEGTTKPAETESKTAKADSKATKADSKADAEDPA